MTLQSRKGNAATAGAKARESSMTVGSPGQAQESALDGAASSSRTAETESLVAAAEGLAQGCDEDGNHEHENENESNNMSPAKQDRQKCIQYWKDSPYAVGVVPPTWADEIHHRQRRAEDANNITSRGTRTPSICTHACHSTSQDLEGMCCCHILTGWICGGQSRCCARCKTRRIGNMIVLRERPFDASKKDRGQDSDEDSEDEGETEGNHREQGGDEESLATRQTQGRSRSYKPPDPPTQLLWVLGPYWPCLFFCTYPLVLGISGATLVIAIPTKPLVVQILWAIFTLMLLYMLCNVSCRDPGMLLRHAEDPSQSLSEYRSRRTGGAWRWNDTARTFYPRNAQYDHDCKVVVEGYDHLCPWTGTVIGRKNMGAFQGFFGAMAFCFFMDVFLLLSVAIEKAAELEVSSPHAAKAARAAAKIAFTGEG
jgi:hypothetical protein